MVRRAKALSGVLRDSLPASALLDTTVREIVARRGREGVRILLSSDSEDGSARGRRASFPTCLPVSARTHSFVLRVTEAPAAATLIMDYGDDAGSRQMDLPVLPDWLTAKTTNLEQTLVVEIIPRESPRHPDAAWFLRSSLAGRTSLLAAAAH
jgi:hypothetical protein